MDISKNFHLFRDIEKHGFLGNNPKALLCFMIKAVSLFFKGPSNLKKTLKEKFNSPDLLKFQISILGYLNFSQLVKGSKITSRCQDHSMEKEYSFQ